MVYDSGKFNITLKKVIRRIEGLDNNSRIIWTKEILSELGSDVMSKTYHDGYEQGRFDEAMENTIKVKKVEIPDYIVHWIDYCKLTNVDFVRNFLVDKYCLSNYVYGEVSDTWYFGKGESINLRTLHTKKELEDAGFGWVFHCNGIKTYEVYK